MADNYETRRAIEEAARLLRADDLFRGSEFEARLIVRLLLDAGWSPPS